MLDRRYTNLRQELDGNNMGNDSGDPIDDFISRWQSGEGDNEGVLYKRLCVRFEEIEVMLSTGKSHQNIVDGLNACGVEISLSTFRTYLYRFRREHAEWNEQMKEGRKSRKFGGG